MTTPTPTTDTTITTPPTITQAEEDKRDQKKLAQAKKRRDKANEEGHNETLDFIPNRLLSTNATTGKMQ